MRFVSFAPMSASAIALLVTLLPLPAYAQWQKDSIIELFGVTYSVPPVTGRTTGAIKICDDDPSTPPNPTQVSFTKTYLTITSSESIVGKKDAPNSAGSVSGQFRQGFTWLSGGTTSPIRVDLQFRLSGSGTNNASKNYYVLSTSSATYFMRGLLGSGQTGQPIQKQFVLKNGKSMGSPDIPNGIYVGIPEQVCGANDVYSVYNDYFTRKVRWDLSSNGSGATNGTSLTGDPFSVSATATGEASVGN